MTLTEKMRNAGLPYEITDQKTPAFLLSGGTSVVALYSFAGTDRAFVGFHGTIEAAGVAREARKIRGCHSAYVVTANEKE